MTRTSPPQVAFNAGEIDRLLHARFDYQRFQTGMDTCRGYLPLPQGGFTRAPGTTYLGEPKAAACVLVPFQFASDDAVVLEFTPGFMRVWRYGQPVLKADLTGPYELATPFGVNDLPSLRWVQSADVIYLVDGRNPPQRLARFALNSWTISAQILETGPFRVQNLDETKRISVSAFTGTITITADFPLFSASHVGSAMLLSPEDVTVPILTTNSPVPAGSLRRVGKNIYRMVSPAEIDSKEGIPTHTEGVQDYGHNTLWEFVCDDVGIVRITAVSSPTSATAVVVRTLNPSLVSSPSYRWSEGAYSAIYGYPSSIELYDQRLVFAATPAEPRTLWFSTVGSFSDFLPSIEPDGAFAYSIAGTGSQNRITGLRQGRNGLHIFALSEEYSTRSETRAAVIGPTTARFVLDGSTGAKPGQIIAPDGNPVFISRDGRKVYQIIYDLQSDGNQGVNLIRASQHIGAVGLKKIVWQQTPEPRAWVLRETGDLGVMIFDAAEEILGWSTHSVRGTIIDLCVTQNEQGTEDEVFLVVQRSIAGGATTTSLEMLDFRHHLMMASYVDLRDSGAATIASLSVPWLAQAEVLLESVAAPDSVLPDYLEEARTVPPDGILTLSSASRYAVAGLFANDHKAVSLDIQAAARDGNSIGRNKRLHPSMPIMLHETRGGKVRVIEGHGPRMPSVYSAPADLLDPGVGRDSAPAYSGLVEIALPTGQAKKIQIEFSPSGNKPMTVLGMFPTIQEAGR